MRKTNSANENGYSNEYLNPITVDTNGLQTILGCGRPTAVQIGTEAQARVVVGKRLLWNVAKVQKYLDTIATS
jgi:hypothetical protein